MVRCSSFSLALAATLFVFGATCSSAASIAQAGVVHIREVDQFDDGTRQNTIASSAQDDSNARYGTLDKRDNDEFTAGGRSGGLTRQDHDDLLVHGRSGDVMAAQRPLVPAMR